MRSSLTPGAKLTVCGFFISKVLFTPIAFAQIKNLGINTTTPAAALDVKGTMRTGGLNSYISYDSVSGKVSWKNSQLFLPASQALIRHSATNEGLYYNSFALEYRNQTSNPVFFTNWSSANGYFGGSLGIGTMNPVSRLHVWSGNSGFTPNFSTMVVEASGDNSIHFFTPDSYQSALLFENPSQLQSGGIYYNSPGAADGFIFRTNNAPRAYIDNNGNLGIGGYPHSRLYISNYSTGYSGSYFPGITIEGYGGVDVVTSFSSENGILFGNNLNLASGGIVYNNPGTPNGMQFRVNGNLTKMVLSKDGYVGIGNLDPSFVLDLSGRMRIRSGGNNSVSAGLWLNNNSNTEAAFIGMEDDSHIGFFGNNGAGWKFSMNTQTGAFKINGSEGAAGQVITSNGSAAPDWKSPTKSLYDNTVMKTQNTNLTMTSASSPTVIPNLTHTFTVTGNAKVLVSMSLDAGQPNCNPCGNGYVDVELQLDGAAVTRFWEHQDNGYYKIVKSEFVVSAGAGTHTVRLVARPATPGVSVEYIGGNSTLYTSTAIFVVIPE